MYQRAVGQWSAGLPRLIDCPLAAGLVRLPGLLKACCLMGVQPGLSRLSGLSGSHPAISRFPLGVEDGQTACAAYYVGTM